MGQLKRQKEERHTIRLCYHHSSNNLELVSLAARKYDFHLGGGSLTFCMISIDHTPLGAVAKCTAALFSLALMVCRWSLLVDLQLLLLLPTLPWRLRL